MNIVLTVLQISAPVFVLGLIGVVWVRVLKWEYPLQFVTRLAMTVAVPCLIFTTLVGSSITPAALATLSAASVLAYVAATLAFWLMTGVLAIDRRTYLAPLVFGNTGNIGLPLALFAFGEVGLSYAIVVFAIMAMFTFTIGIWMVAGAASGLRVLAEPMVIAAVLGTVFLWQGWQVTGWISNALTLAGQMGIPLMLITLGVAVARLSAGQFRSAIGLSLLKAVVCAGIGLGIGLALRLEPVALAVLIVQMMTPVAVTSYLLAEKYEADAEAVAGLVVVSTLLSVALLPVVLGLLLPSLPSENM